ncbi:hypothetical protein ACLK12_12280 [Escherichia coli]
MFDGIAFSLAQSEVALFAAACPLPLWGLIIVTLTLLAHDLTFGGLSFYCSSGDPDSDHGGSGIT